MFACSHPTSYLSRLPSVIDVLLPSLLPIVPQMATVSYFILARSLVQNAITFWTSLAFYPMSTRILLSHPLFRLYTPLTIPKLCILACSILITSLLLRIEQKIFRRHLQMPHPYPPPPPPLSMERFLSQSHIIFPPIVPTNLRRMLPVHFLIPNVLTLLYPSLLNLLRFYVPLLQIRIAPMILSHPHSYHLLSRTDYRQSRRRRLCLAGSSLETCFIGTILPDKEKSLA